MTKRTGDEWMDAQVCKLSHGVTSKHLNRRSSIFCFYLRTQRSLNNNNYIRAFPVTTVLHLSSRVTRVSCALDFHQFHWNKNFSLCHCYYLIRLLWYDTDPISINKEAQLLNSCIDDHSTSHYQPRDSRWSWKFIKWEEMLCDWNRSENGKVVSSLGDIVPQPQIFLSRKVTN